MAGEAIRRTVRYMLEPPGSGEGVSGMRRMAEELPEWPALEDAAWCARFGYQAVEKRGSGGGNFRPLYADFLEEMAALGLPLGEQVAPCRALGRGWTTFAATLKRLAFAQAAPEAASAARRAGAELKALADAEEAFLEGLAQAVERA
jgi:hypothetical protein